MAGKCSPEKNLLSIPNERKQMKPILRAAILTGGVLNLLLALFHIFLCYKIYVAQSGSPIYPLLEMLAICGTLMIFFLAATSLLYRTELVTAKIGQPIILLNIAVYLSRTLGEFILFSQQNFLIIVVCSFLTILYVYIFIVGRKYKFAITKI
jgi:hypothetical protein